MSVVEVSVRLFYTDEQAADVDFCPKVTIVVPTETLVGSTHPPDWGALVQKLREVAASIPVAVREMTPAEVKSFRASESED